MGVRLRVWVESTCRQVHVQELWRHSFKTRFVVRGGEGEVDEERGMNGLDVYLMSLTALLMSDLWMWGITPPPAIVACTQRVGETDPSVG